MNDLKEVNIKNRICHYSDGIIKTEGFGFDNVLIDEKSYENILFYDVSFKTLFASKSLRIRFDKVDGFIRVYDGIRSLVLFGPEKYNSIYDKTRYLIRQISSITYIIFHNFPKVKIDSYDFFAFEQKTLKLHNASIFIKSVFKR